MFEKLTRPVMLAVAVLALVVISVNVSAQIPQDQDDNYYLQDHDDFNENGIPDEQEREDLPDTAGALPLLAMLGGVSIAGSACTRFVGRAKNR